MGVFPAATLPQIEAMLCAENQPFEMEVVDIHGVPTRTWKHLHQNLADLAVHASGHGDALLHIYADERLSYENWFRAVAALAHELRDMGARPGDRVALAMRNLPEWSVCFFATVAIGAISVPVNAWWTGEELAFALKNSGSSFLIADDDRWQRTAPHRKSIPGLTQVILARGERTDGTVRALEDMIGGPPDYANLPERGLPDMALTPETRAAIMYTSGTTGKPKGAIISHRNLVTNILSSKWATARAFIRAGQPLPEPAPKVLLTVIPMFHATALSAMLMGVLDAGHSMVFMHKWDPVEAFKLIEREKVNAAGGVPTIAWQMLEHPDREKYDLSSLESVSYGGAPSAPELVRRIHEVFGSSPGNGWGMTETTATVTSHSGEDYLHRPESAGPPVPVADLRITDPDGNDLPVGTVGELWAKGPQVVEGYWERPEANRETFIDGWVRTGDLARVDEEGFLFIVDRAKDMLIRGGENIYSSEVENVLYDHPAVMDAAIVGIPHKTLGEEPGAVVALTKGKTAGEDELKAHVRAHLAAFKVPVRIIFHDEMLPRNANGKILKNDLKALFS
ncbi:acyl--CoA ligase [Pacificimonas sp. WHA3]|uniref:Acyl--CoA ligase n=1 Tax=Pacificimonas pallii TaxID=2827236 RepID=A0ABS6SE17_9SPHN|nr:class I adenylate-forming enzyme family protein [Pacificimonas pallii]MBV7256166.1 acyl--CoA ligase [Pacificimonas pallii]